MSYLDDTTYDEASGPMGRVHPTYDDLIGRGFSEADADYWLDSGHDLTLCDDLFDVGDSFTEQLKAELDADMAAAMYEFAFGEAADAA